MELLPEHKFDLLLPPGTKDYTSRRNNWAFWFSLLSIVMPISLFGLVLYIFTISIILPTSGSLPSGLNIGSTPTNLTEVLPLVQGPSPFDALSLEAKAVYVFDERAGKVLFAKNEEAQLPLASLTKIMTALAAVELLPDYTTLTIPSEALKDQPGSGLIANERWRFQDLMDFTLVMSSNAGADAIAGAAGAGLLGRDQNGGTADYSRGKTAFVDYLNSKARSIGLAQTYFVNNTGLDQTTEISGGYGSAKDIATLFRYVLHNHPNLFAATRYPSITLESIDGKKHMAINTDTITQDIPGLIASKTGLTDLAGGNLAVAFDAAFGHEIIAVVMGSTEQGRFDDMKKLVGATLASFSYGEK